MSAIDKLFAERGKHVYVGAETKIITRGNKVGGVFWVQSGQVLIHSTSVRDREVGIDIVKPGEIFGVISVIRDATAEVDATALTECDLLCIERGYIEHLKQSDIRFTNELLSYTVNLVAERTRQVEELAVCSLKSRLARWLLRTFDEHRIDVTAGAAIQLTASQRLVAIMAGVSRETVNRQLKKWVAAEIIELSGRNLRLLKPNVLRRMAGDSTHFIADC